MTLQLIKKPPTKPGFNERVKITLMGNHTLKQKAAMLMEAKYWLEHEHGFSAAGLTHVYLPLIDAHGHPLTHFANGDPIADWDIVINSPYHCAADQYQT